MTDVRMKVWLSRLDREALREYAWANRTNMKGVVVAAVEDVRDNPSDSSGLSQFDSPSEVQLSLIVDSKLWADAHASARDGGLGSFSSLLRRRLRKVLIDEGYLK